MHRHTYTHTYSVTHLTSHCIILPHIASPHSFSLTHSVTQSLTHSLTHWTVSLLKQTVFSKLSGILHLPVWKTRLFYPLAALQLGTNHHPPILHLIFCPLILPFCLKVSHEAPVMLSFITLSTTQTAFTVSDVDLAMETHKNIL